MYSQTGLTLIWCADDCTFTIALRPHASDDTSRRAMDAMGYTPGGGEERGRLAFVLINRVNEIADGYSTARSLVLGAPLRTSWAICSSPMTASAPAVLAEARETLTQIYRAAGIGVQWKTVGTDFSVYVISRPPQAARVSSFALGYVPSNEAKRGRQAFVLADRIRDRSSELAVSFQLILGLTMAHEVAHLLLPYESHSVDGIMRNAPGIHPITGRQDLGSCSSRTNEEAQLMRDRLTVEPVAVQAEP